MVGCGRGVGVGVGVGLGVGGGGGVYISRVSLSTDLTGAAGDEFTREMIAHCAHFHCRFVTRGSCRQ